MFLSRLEIFFYIFFFAKVPIDWFGLERNHHNLINRIGERSHASFAGLLLMTKNYYIFHLLWWWFYFVQKVLFRKVIPSSASSAEFFDD